MNQEQISTPSSKLAPIEVNLDEFMIDEDSFKPMTKGLGFHHDQKRPTFKAAPKDIKPIVSTGAKAQAHLSTTLSALASQAVVKVNGTSTSSTHIPSGLEAFYGSKPEINSTQFKDEFFENKTDQKVGAKSILKPASMVAQFFAWIIDISVIFSFVILTGALLVLASGIEFKMYSKLISNEDLAIFATAIFSIYYLLYFTILDLSSSPGKTVMGIRLLKINGKNVSVRETFLRSLISLLSGIALFLPMLLDFQGRLSDTKVVK